MRKMCIRDRYSSWHKKSPHLLFSISYCLTNGVQFIKVLVTCTMAVSTISFTKKMERCSKLFTKALFLWCRQWFICKKAFMGRKERIWSRWQKVWKKKFCLWQKSWKDKMKFPENCLNRAVACCFAGQEKLSKKKNKKLESFMNCTPFVRQYDILNNKWGDFLCQEEYQINDIHQNSRKW